MRPGLKLYFVRHGETDWNAERRYQGQTDIPLNARGRDQSRRNGDALRAFLPAITQADFVASPLVRTRETMELLRTSLGLDPARSTGPRPSSAIRSSPRTVASRDACARTSWASTRNRSPIW